ncbi:MAG: ERF family protein, partial [Acidobacteria bacterium]|nr:ERF family protein [Acidobacteriota bacterium]
RLMALWERAEARKAEQVFNAAMSAAQSEMRSVAADATNPQTHSRYASYEALDRALRPLYTKHGFGLSFNTEDAAPDYVRVVCYVSHLGGHTRPYRVDMPADGKGAKGGDVMTKTHAVGAAMSYGARYLLKLIWNVAVGEGDKDGNAPPQKPAPEGFDDWREDMRSLLEGGGSYVQLAEAWKKSKEVYRDYLAKHHKGVAEGWKTTAKANDKKAATS